VFNTVPHIAMNSLHIAQIPLGLSRLDTTQHVRRVERVETSVSSRAVPKKARWPTVVEMLLPLGSRAQCEEC